MKYLPPSSAPLLKIILQAQVKCDPFCILSHRSTLEWLIWLPQYGHVEQHDVMQFVAEYCNNLPLPSLLSHYDLVRIPLHGGGPREMLTSTLYYYKIMERLKAGWPHLQDYPDMPPDYRHTQTGRFPWLVMTISRHFASLAKPSPLTVEPKQTHKRTGGCCQVHYLPAMQCFAVNHHIIWRAVICPHEQW